MPRANSTSFYDEILTKFLYGQQETPGNLIDDGLIRPNGPRGLSVSVDKSDYMLVDYGGITVTVY